MPNVNNPRLLRVDGDAQRLQDATGRCQRRARLRRGRAGDNPIVRVSRELIAFAADSDEVAWAIRDDVARDYEMMSPGFGASLARAFLALAE